jgi:hypothetical protein
MVLDGLRGYLQLASGLTDVTRERARAAARSLVAQSEAGVGGMLPDQLRAQVGSVAEDLVATSRANRDLLMGLVRAEVERSVTRLGLVSAEELKAAAARARTLDRRVEELERALQAAEGRAAGRTSRASTATKSTATKSTAKKSTATKSTAKKSTAKKSTAKKSTAKKSTAKKSTATKSAAGRKSAAGGSAAATSTGRATAKRAPAKRATAKRATAKRAGAGTGTARRSTGGSA